jgi:hypothetical protein
MTLDSSHPLHPDNQLGAGLRGGLVLPRWLVYIFFVVALYIVSKILLYLLQNPVGRGKQFKVAGKRKEKKS